MAVALSAVLGHAFSPFLGFRGGKAVAVTYGVIVTLPQHEILLSLAVFMVLGFLFIESHAWTVIFGATASLAYLAVTRGGSWESMLILGVLLILVFKHFEDLRVMPHARARLVRWLHMIIRGTQLTI
jgi:glycerol-3-phosphate acyltransferase PlsY